VMQVARVKMVELLHNLQLTVLVARILEHLFDRDNLAGFDYLCLIHNSEGADSDLLQRRVVVILGRDQVDRLVVTS